MDYNNLITIKRIKAKSDINPCRGCIFNTSQVPIEGINCSNSDCTGGVLYKPMIHYIFVKVGVKGRRA